MTIATIESLNSSRRSDPPGRYHSMTANPFFDGIVAHGYLLVSWAAGLFVAPGRSPVLANYGLENLRFITPVRIDDSVLVVLTCREIRPRVDADYGEVVWDAVLTNQCDEVVANYGVLTLAAKDESQALGSRALFLHQMPWPI